MPADPMVRRYRNLIIRHFAMMKGGEPPVTNWDLTTLQECEAEAERKYPAVEKKRRGKK